jgi:tRNA pseudouridine55 synthase
MNNDGLLLIDKPLGWTSHDVVAKVRNILKNEAGKKIKVGHTGTLDPLASGLMILVVGSYCKRASEFSKLDKTYEATVKLGQTSSTGDAEGEKVNVSDAKPTETEVKHTLSSFVGEIEQTPSIYSAIKVDGKRAYKLAREGKEVKIEPRKVTIHSLELTNYSYPKLSFCTSVSSGTYIRTLGEDIGKRLRTGAYLSDLRRTEVGGFSLVDSINPAEISIDKIIKT